MSSNLITIDQWKASEAMKPRLEIKDSTGIVLLVEPSDYEYLSIRQHTYSLTKEQAISLRDFLNKVIE